MEKVKTKWASLNGNLRMVIMALLVAIPLALVVVTVWWPSGYQSLYSGLNADDETAIERFLSDKQVDYRKKEEGTIEVKGDALAIKRSLALEGLPSGGVGSGLESFGKATIGSTKYDKDVQYQAGLQRDLNKNLVELFEGVQKAEVKLPKPKEQSYFDDEKTETMVSVGLKLKPGVELSPEQVSAIQVFVAGALTNVQSDNVKVVDSKMNVLSDFEKDSKGTNKQQEIEDKAKAELEKQLRETLSKVYGPVEVMATVDINFDEIVQNIKKYDPEGTLLSKESNVEKTRQIEGVDKLEPGTDANGEVPRYEIDDLEREGDTLLAQDKDHIIENFQVGETVEKIIKHPELRNTNVAVWIDGVLADDEIIELEEMVAVGSGLTGTAQRDNNAKATYTNGSVKVTQKTFKTVAEEELTFEEEAEQAGIPLWVWITAGAVGLLLIIIVIIIALRKKKSRVVPSEISEIEEGPLPTPTPKEVEQVDEELIQGIQRFKIGKMTKEQRDLREVAGETASKNAKETADWVRKQLND